MPYNLSLTWNLNRTCLCGLSACTRLTTKEEQDHSAACLRFLLQTNKMTSTKGRGNNKFSEALTLFLFVLFHNALNRIAIDIGLVCLRIQRNKDRFTLCPPIINNAVTATLPPLIIAVFDSHFINAITYSRHLVARRLTCFQLFYQGFYILSD